MNVPVYIRALLGHLEDCPLPDGLHHVEIRHDADCSHWDGQPCDCEPAVESGARIERKYGERGQE